MDHTIRLLKELVAIDSVNPSLVPGAAGEAAIARALVDELRSIGLQVEVQEAAPGRPNVVGTLAGRAPGRIADVLRPHRHGRRRRHDAAVRSGRARRPHLRPRLAGHEERRRGDDRRRARDRRLGRPRRRRPRHRLRRRRRAREHRRRCAGHALARRRRQWSPSRPIWRWRSRTRDSSGSRSRRKAAPRMAAARATAATPSCAWVACWSSSRRSIGRCRPDARTRWSAPASLHASLIEGGRELSSYPDRCSLQIERRTIPGEPRGLRGARGRAHSRRAARDRIRSSRPPAG